MPLTPDQRASLFSHYHHANRLLKSPHWLAVDQPRRITALHREKVSIILRLAASGALPLMRLK